MKKILFSLCVTISAFSANAFAQPRPVGKAAETTPAATQTAMPAPSSVAAKYEGGMFGYSKKETGTIRFDDANERLVFFGSDQKEKFGIPYKSIMVIYPQSQSVRSTTGTVVSAIPLPGAGLASLMRSKRRYLIVNFDDPDANARGVASFKIENKELLGSVLQTLGTKAKMQQRGDAYFRPREPQKAVM